LEEEVSKTELLQTQLRDARQQAVASRESVSLITKTMEEQARKHEAELEQVKEKLGSEIQSRERSAQEQIGQLDRELVSLRLQLKTAGR